MTPQEAIKWADGKALEIICELEVTKSKERQKRLNEEYSALTTFKSCAESQIPKKPNNLIQIGTSFDLRTGIHTHYFEGLCPICEIRNTNRRAGEKITYCEMCGQKLSWESDTE